MQEPSDASRTEMPDLRPKADEPSLRNARRFACVGLAAAVLVGAVYLGYGLYLLMSGQTGYVSRETFVMATAETITRELRASSFSATAPAESAQTQTAGKTQDASIGGRAGPSLDHLDRVVDPCVPTAEVSEPCATGRTVQFPGAVPMSPSYPDEPPTLEAMLFNSWDGGALSDVPNDALLSATHIIARGRFANESLRCEAYPLINPSWAVDHADFGVNGLPEGQSFVVDFGIDHWMCFAEFAVHEYMVGTGGSNVIVNLVAAAVPLDAGDGIESIYDQQTLDVYRTAVADHFFGSDWVVWLGPSYSTAVESWTAYSLWDVQRGDDDVVRVVSPVADHYEDVGLTGSTLERLRTPIADFRRDIKAAHAARIERTSGRIGVSTDTPKLVTDIFKLEDYYEEVGAYSNPIATPAPSPTRPYPPTEVIATLWNRTHPEVDLEWSAPVSSQVTSYKILRVDNLGNQKTVATDLDAQVTEYTDWFLPILGAEYTYTVIAVNAHGESEPSGSVTIRSGAPNSPGLDLEVTLEPVYEANLVWHTPRYSYVTGYRLERKTGDGEWVTLAADLGTEHFRFTDRPLQSGITYLYRVVAFNEWAESAPSAPEALRLP